ncbi:MAG: CHRD domain-containing protein [Actinobacteria bacterium]|nr:MAG: CHRD domain-containing protein [Actinomycetota bacterium]
MRARLLIVGAIVAVVVPVTAMASSAMMSPVVSAKLLGKNEVPKGSPTGSGLVVVHLNAAKGTVCWTFAKVVKIGKPMVAHIHKAKVGVSGPVVVPLGGAYKAKGCTKASKKLVGAIEEHPAGYYVNIHTAKYPAGAIRGQLVVGMHG